MCWKEIKESPNYEKLKKSVELKFALGMLALYAGITLVCGALIAVAVGVSADSSGLVMPILVLLLIPVPMACFYLYRIFMIFYQIQDYTFSEVVLDRPHSGLTRGMMCFTLEVKNRNGVAVQAQTHEIFVLQGIMEPSFDDYVNQKVLIAYNETTEYVVVVGNDQMSEEYPKQ